MPNEINNFMNNAPQWLLALKQQQTQKQQSDREFAFKQQQAAQQQSNLEKQWKQQNKQERLSIVTDLLGETEDFGQKSILTQMLSNIDPENAGVYSALGGSFQSQATKQKNEEDLFKSYARGDTFAEEFFSSVPIDSKAFKAAIDYDKSNGIETRAFEGWVWQRNQTTGEVTRSRIGGTPTGFDSNLERSRDIVSDLSDPTKVRRMSPDAFGQLQTEYNWLTNEIRKAQGYENYPILDLESFKYQQPNYEE